MTYEQIAAQADKINWWHTIDLGSGYVTKGRVGLDHCAPEVLTKRFGIPEDLSGKTVLDVGCWDGLMSFEAEKRGAKAVTAIDKFQGEGESGAGVVLAMSVLKSQVAFYNVHLAIIAGAERNRHDITFYFGVLYHVDDPIQELKYLRSVTREYALIETAVCGDNGYPTWEFRPGKEGDPTNKWYPSIEGLRVALAHAGFSSVEVIYNDGIRATVKAIV